MPRSSNHALCFLQTGLTRRYAFHRRLIQGFLILLVIWTCLEVSFVYHGISAAERSRPQSTRRDERIYIASMHWNNEAILRSHWNDAVLEVVKTWGPGNVFVSVFESGSWDDSKSALRQLDNQLDQLGVRRNITLSGRTHQDEVSAPPSGDGWIYTSRNKEEPRRVPYLARLRNLTLRHLEDLARQGITFDKILFLNDVVFTVDDVLSLLNTNDGHYAAACSLDFSKPPLFYDTFALRDIEGYEHIMQEWPYFRAAASRRALLTMSPVPVKSCWNGMVVMSTEPFLSERPLRFRGISDSLARQHLEASECCLIHADNPLSSTRGIYLNPNVRVGYNAAAYDAVHRTSAWIGLRHIAMSLWENRLRRWMTTPLLKRLVVRNRLNRWKADADDRVEPGEYCLVNEMQVLVANGWAHV